MLGANVGSSDGGRIEERLTEATSRPATHLLHLVTNEMAIKWVDREPTTRRGASDELLLLGHHHWSEFGPRVRR